MTGTWSWLFGIDLPPGGGDDARLVFAGIEALDWLLPALLGACVLSWWLYRRWRAELGPVRRGLLVALRCGALVTLAVILLRPQLLVTDETRVRPTVVLLLDESASMSIADARLENADRVRAAIATGLLPASSSIDEPVSDETPADPAHAFTDVARVDLVRSALASEELALVERLGERFDVRAFSFGETLTSVPASELGDADADAESTPLGSALRRVAETSRGQPVAGVIVITDGASNRGTSVASAADLLARQQLPVYPWAVGVTDARDVALLELDHAEAVFRDDAVAAEVTLESSGVGGQLVDVVLTANEEEVARQRVVLTDARQRVALEFTTETSGEFELVARVDPLVGEVREQNNRTRSTLRVIDRRVRVLYVEGEPRWEFRYLQPLLLRDDRLESRFVLSSADASIAEEEGSPYLSGFPTDDAELFAYDLVILGEVDPQTLPGGALGQLDRFVSEFGGAVAVIAGRRHMPASLDGTALEPMLPVLIGQASEPTDEGVDAFRAEPSAEGRLDPLLRLGAVTDHVDDSVPAGVDDVWPSMPELYWAASVEDVAAAATVLLQHPTRKTSEAEPLPILALRQFGRGQVAYVGSDNLWRWRGNGRERLYNRFWGNLVLRLALPKVTGTGAGRTQLSQVTTPALTGSPVRVRARVFDENYQPVVRASVRATATLREGDASSEGTAPRRSPLLLPVPDEPGVYEGQFVATEPGVWRVATVDEPETVLEVDVREDDAEPAEPAMQLETLRQLARRTGGVLVREEDLMQLPDLPRGEERVLTRQSRHDLWDSFPPLVLVVVLLGTEWTLRKLWELK